MTRPEHQAESLCKAIEAQGGHVIRWPLLTIEPITESLETQQNINKLRNYDLVIFISANAVSFGLAAINNHQSSLQNAQIFAVGKATATALHQSGIERVKVPEVASSVGLLEMSEFDPDRVKGKRCLVFRGKGGNETLVRTLKQRKLQAVDYAEVYQRIDSQSDPLILETHWQKKQLDVIIVTSCSGLDNLFAILDAKNHIQLCSTTLITVSNRVSNYAQKLGFHGHILTAHSASDQDIIESMQDWYQMRKLYD